MEHADLDQLTGINICPAVVRQHLRVEQIDPFAIRRVRDHAGAAEATAEVPTRRGGAGGTESHSSHGV